MDATNTNCSVNNLTNSDILLTKYSPRTWKKLKSVLRETTVEPCLFTYMMCTAISSLAVQSMHLEKACRVNFKYGDEICDRMQNRNTTGIENQLNEIQLLVAMVVAWKFPLQIGIPAIMVIFVGAWSDKYMKRKICILFPFIGEIISNIGMLLATYYFKELSLTPTTLIAALPAAFTGSYIVIFVGMYSFMADRTTIENRTFRLGIVSIFVTIGTPTGTALSGILLRAIGYYGVFSLLLFLYTLSFIYGMLTLEDVMPKESNCNDSIENKSMGILSEVLQLVRNTVMVALKPRAFCGRLQIFAILLVYLLMVGPLYGDSQVSFLYSIRRFAFSEIEYSIYSTTNISLGVLGSIFCIWIFNQKLLVEDSITGIIASVSRIAGCFMFAFAPNRSWYYSAPVFNIFGATGLICVRSIAAKCVPTEEVGKLNALIAVSEALASAIYMPASTYIYKKTISTFPGAFYMWDAALTVIAIGLFWFIYILDRKRETAVVKDPRKKEEITNKNDIPNI